MSTGPLCDCKEICRRFAFGHGRCRVDAAKTDSSIDKSTLPLDKSTIPVCNFEDCLLDAKRDGFCLHHGKIGTACARCGHEKHEHLPVPLTSVQAGNRTLLCPTATYEERT